MRGPLAGDESKREAEEIFRQHRFEVHIVPEASEDFDALERFEVWDGASDSVIYGAQLQQDAEIIAARLNGWWAAHEERASFGSIASGVL